ncbi:PEP-CTERM sorting domain-containing protein [Candidatus Nitrotoga sp. AM1P]|uniref:PEP-CTERM sorting domain-containing protein n=1 Tax=Candidatus Nitrotoga sp. AM1P TaxID=2559597 RepID=UPI0015650B8A|nr:PEP-CTERM sorting domain-containing protein [Candidatus Nitrotoga sp. AM1P]
MLRVLILIAGTAVSVASYATPLEWSITNPTVSAAPGDTVIFMGVITNRTGHILESTDLFLDFLAFDFNVLSPNQVLGTIPFTLPDFTFSANVALFNVDVNLLAASGIRELQVLLQDMNGNLTDTINVTVAVNGVTSNVPEPSTTALFTLGFIILLVAFHRRLIADKGNWHKARVGRSIWL